MEINRDAADPNSAFSLLVAMVTDPKAEVSLGAYGAIGQFAREPRIFVELEGDRVVAATETSSISLRRHENLRAIAFEVLSSDPAGWNGLVAICLPEHDARMSARTELTIVDQDEDAIFPGDRTGATHDIGVGKAYADICVRAYSGDLRAEGNPLPKGEFLTQLLQRDDCVWIFNTALGRIETRDRRRRHFIPQLLAGNETHSRGAPIPPGFVPVGYAFPPNPLHPETENRAASHHSFQALLDLFGVSGVVAFKRRLELALDVGTPLAGLQAVLDHSGSPTRMEIECIRVALRQRRWLRDGPRVPEWEEAFDRPLARTVSSSTVSDQPCAMR